VAILFVRKKRKKKSKSKSKKIESKNNLQIWKFGYLLDTDLATFNKIQLLLYKHRSNFLPWWFPEVKMKKLFKEVLRWKGSKNILSKYSDHLCQETKLLDYKTSVYLAAAFNFPLWHAEDRFSLSALHHSFIEFHFNPTITGLKGLDIDPRKKFILYDIFVNELEQCCSQKLMKSFRNYIRYHKFRRKYANPCLAKCYPLSINNFHLNSLEFKAVITKTTSLFFHNWYTCDNVYAVEDLCNDHDVLILQ